MWNWSPKLNLKNMFSREPSANGFRIFLTREPSAQKSGESKRDYVMIISDLYVTCSHVKRKINSLGFAASSYCFERLRPQI